MASLRHILTMDDRNQDRPKSKATSGRLGRWAWRGILVLAFGGVLAAMAYWSRTFLLTEMAKAWVVNEPVAKADAIVVLGGGVDTRPFAAAKLYNAGVAPVILYMNVKLTPADKMGLAISEKDETQNILLSNSVPESAIQAIGTNVASTYDESRAVRAWDLRRGAKSILIVTDFFHTRRARWIFEKELKETGVQVHVQGVATLEYGIADWWKHEDGVIAFQNEIMKYIYYRFVY
jgi:uncharacterized SAM-binding protein YcdF (DUF218 family)